MKKQKEITTTIENNTLTIQALGQEALVISISDLNQEMQEASMLHGLKQKIVDSAALGAGYSTNEKYLAMKEVVERITSEDASWNKRAEGGGAVSGLLFRALVRLYPDKDPAALRAYHDKLDKSQQAALRKSPTIANEIELIKSESTNTKGIDTTDLLAELGGI